MRLKKFSQYFEYVILLLGCIVSIVATVTSNKIAIKNEQKADSVTLSNNKLQTEILSLQTRSDSVQQVINQSNDSIINLQKTIIQLQNEMNVTIKGEGYPILIPKVVKIGLSHFLEIQIQNLHSYPINEVKVDYIDAYNKFKDKVIEEHVAYTGHETTEQIQAMTERRIRGYNRSSVFVSLTSMESREFYFERIIGYFTWVDYNIKVMTKFGSPYEFKFSLASITPGNSGIGVESISYVVGEKEYNEKEFIKKFVAK